MRYDSLKLLRCPRCGGNLSLLGTPSAGAIHEGALICDRQHHRFPVIVGIPRFINPKDLVGLNEKYATLYSWISSFYDSNFFIASKIREMFWPSGEEKARREVIERLELEDAHLILETGIGSGANLPGLLRRAPGARVHGVDISMGMLGQCLRNLKRWGLEADLYLGNSEDLPFRDESFDAVFHLGAINFYTDKEQAIREMIRVAKPGTRIVIADESDKVAESEGWIGRIGVRLFFGKRLYDEIYSFRCQDVVNLVPENMLEVGFDPIWDGNGYRLEFRKP